MIKKILQFSTAMLVLSLALYPGIIHLDECTSTKTCITSAIEPIYLCILNLYNIDRWDISREVYLSARETGVDPLLILSIISIESSFQDSVISWAGAQGLMGVKPIAAREAGWNGQESLYDAPTNIRAGSGYLALLLEDMGLQEALEAYFRGPTGSALYLGEPTYYRRIYREYMRIRRKYEQGMPALDLTI